MSDTKIPAAPMKVLDHLNSLTPQQMVQDPMITSKFVDLYNAVHGTTNGKEFHAAEQFYFLKKVQESESLKACTKLSLYGCFLDVAVNGLSFNPQQNLAYIIPDNFNVGTKEHKVYEKRAIVVPTPYGELALRMRAGQVKSVDNPVIIYDCDQISIETTNNQKMISHKMMIPRKANAKIIGAFMKITRPDGTFDYAYLLEEEIARLKAASAKKNNGSANALYTSFHGGIDPGFLAAKVIKHAFKGYPKVKTGRFTKLEEEIEPMGEVIDYGLNKNQPPARIEPKSEFEEALEEKEVPQPSVTVMSGEDEPF